MWTFPHFLHSHTLALYEANEANESINTTLVMLSLCPCNPSITYTEVSCNLVISKNSVPAPRYPIPGRAAFRFQIKYNSCRFGDLETWTRAKDKHADEA